MKYKNDWKAVNTVWWRFFWRYAVIFIAINVIWGIFANFWGQFLPKGMFVIMMLSGILANILATLISMMYCLNRKFPKSPLILQSSAKNDKYSSKILIWGLYFWRFALLAFVIGFALGALLPVVFQYTGFDPVKALKYSKYLGNIAVIPASFLAFVSMICRKETKQTLRIVIAD